MKVSIITPVLNGQDTIGLTINSVLSQSYANIEYIIVDNGSTDRTMDVIDEYQNRISKVLIESVRGIYTTMNNGLRNAEGDIIGILNSDDFYDSSMVIEKVVDQFKKHNTDSCYGDLIYVHKYNPEKIIRYWKSSPYKEGAFQKGWMPPHPTFFVKKKIYAKYGYFNTNFSIAADYELMLRFLQVKKVSTHYIPNVLVKMRYGGESNRNIKNIMRKTYEDYMARKINNLKGNYQAIILKNLSKIPQFLRKEE